MPIKTFRGHIADGGQDTIVLRTNTGATGYRIVKFELFPTAPGTTGQESVVKIFKVKQTSISGTVNFADNTLVASAFMRSPSSAGTASGYTTTMFTVFDKEIFNQDIYLTHDENLGSLAVNYYIELEQVKLDLNENTVATLKDIRNVTAPV